MLNSNIMLLNIFLQGLFSGEFNFKVQMLQLFVLFGSQAYVCFDNNYLSEKWFLIIGFILVLTIAAPLIVLIFKLLHNTELKLKFEELRVYQKLQTSNFIKEEHLKIYRSLAEGIMTVKNGKIDYVNQIVEDIIMGFDIYSERIQNLDERKI